MAKHPLRLPPIEIADESPFANDAFERKDTSDALTRIIDSVEHPFVFAITGPWGCGKTTFLEQWGTALSNSHHSVIKFNAWENDFSESALATMLAELGEGASRLVSRNRGKLDKAISKVVSSGKVVARHLLPAAVKILTYGALNLDDIKKSTIADAATAIANEAIENHIKAKQSIREFKLSLNALVQELSLLNPPSRLVIAVDELDRCRPTYALEMLEVMKHLFDVPGVVFILALDVVQFRSCVGAIYGKDIDATEYLRRFIDMQFALPEPKPDKIAQLLWKQAGLNELESQNQRFGRSLGEVKRVKELFGHYIRLLPRSIRFHQQIVTRISIVLRTLPPNYLLFPDALVFLAYLREINTDAFRGYCNRQLSPTQSIEALFGRQTDALAFVNGADGTRLEANLIIAITNRFEKASIEEYEKTVQRATNQAEQVRARRIIEQVSHAVGDDRSGWIEYLRKKLDLCDHLVE